MLSSIIIIINQSSNHCPSIHSSIHFSVPSLFLPFRRFAHLVVPQSRHEIQDPTLVLHVWCQISICFFAKGTIPSIKQFLVLMGTWVCVWTHFVFQRPIRPRIGPRLGPQRDPGAHREAFHKQAGRGYPGRPHTHFCVERILNCVGFFFVIGGCA